jgi:DNA invertase Pin-like site-specific DNA recombinase
MVMAWSVYRLGRSLRDLIAFLSKAMYQMLGVFAEFERAMIQQRVRAA